MADATSFVPRQESQERNLLADVLTYPLRRGGLLMLAIGAGFSILLHIGTYAAFVGVFVWAFAWGFFGTYYFEIINTTVNGRDDLPDWPDLTNVHEDFWPMLQIAGVSAISLAPFFLT